MSEDYYIIIKCDDKSYAETYANTVTRLSGSEKAAAVPWSPMLEAIFNNDDSFLLDEGEF